MTTLWISIIALLQFIWLWALITHLKSNQIDPTDKICWTVVLCVLNLLGLLLYILIGPTEDEAYGSEEALKKAINEGRR